MQKFEFSIKPYPITYTEQSTKSIVKIVVEPAFTKQNLEGYSVDDLLQLSIRKWETVIAAFEHADAVHDQGWHTCPMCTIHDNCLTCPISQATGTGGCDNTPYEPFGIDKGTLALAKKELEFLKALRISVENGKEWLNNWERLKNARHMEGAKTL